MPGWTGHRTQPKESVHLVDRTRHPSPRHHPHRGLRQARFLRGARGGPDGGHRRPRPARRGPPRAARARSADASRPAAARSAKRSSPAPRAADARLPGHAGARDSAPAAAGARAPAPSTPRSSSSRTSGLVSVEEHRRPPDVPADRAGRTAAAVPARAIGRGTGRPRARRRPARPAPASWRVGGACRSPPGRLDAAATVEAAATILTDAAAQPVPARSPTTRPGARSADAAPSRRRHDGLRAATRRAARRPRPARPARPGRPTAFSARIVSSTRPSRRSPPAGRRTSADRGRGSPARPARRPATVSVRRHEAPVVRRAAGLDAGRGQLQRAGQGRAARPPRRRTGPRTPRAISSPCPSSPKPVTSVAARTPGATSTSEAARLSVRIWSIARGEVLRRWSGPAGAR